jgi:hypothetical protein
VTGESYSSWFLRFLDTFVGRRDRPPVSASSREQWLATFADALHGERADAEAAAVEVQTREDEVAADESESSSSGGYRAQQPAREEKPRYRQIGGDEG